MADIIADIKNTFKRGNIYIQLIYINVAVFLVAALVSVFFRLFNLDAGYLFSFFELPASFGRFAIRPWTVFTYMFMHADFWHIIFNMLWLYWFGNIFLLFYSGKHLRGLYVLGGLCGGVLYMLSFNIFPYFRPIVEYSAMVGASASILAIVLATAYREPNYPIRLLLLGTVRLKYIALFVIIMDLLFLTSDNAGGHIAHLGGALAGLWFATSLSKGKDPTLWINKTLDFIASLFSRKKRRRRAKPTMKVHYSRNKDYEYNTRKKEQSEEIDRILDKLKKSGYDNLTTEEKKRLFDASKK